MKNFYSLHNSEWNNAIEKLLLEHIIYAPVQNNYSIDYNIITIDNISEIVYNIPKPTTPLKTLFNPIKENVTKEMNNQKRIIIGAPNCDIQGLKLLDEIYLDKDFIDPYYQNKRENTILISTTCFETQEHCHCSIYGIKPFANEIADISLSKLDTKIHLEILSEKGENFISELKKNTNINNSAEVDIQDIQLKKNKIEDKILNDNKGLPGYTKTGEIVKKTTESIWDKYSSACVSCGACATICPTCTCFLLLDKPSFEKIRQLDACQYLGFERVAGGEDNLHHLPKRFKNRYFCKYVWKPEKFKSIACTGCGRCIEACIAKINKNELFKEFAK